MKVQYVNDVKKRSDCKKGKPTDITLFSEYTVVEEHSEQFSVLNDFGKLSRYGKSRFIISNNDVVPEIRKAFNVLTNPMRSELKRLRKLVEDQNKTIDELRK